MDTIPVQGAPHQTYVIPSTSRVYAAGADGLLHADPADVPVLVWLGCVLAEYVPYPENLPDPQPLPTTEDVVQELAHDARGSDSIPAGEGDPPPAS